MSISIHNTPPSKLGAEEFYRQAMGLPPTPDQQKGIDWLSSTGRYMLMRSANGTGKTAFLSATALYTMYKHPNCVVLALSKNMTHLKRNFWASLKRQAKNLGGIFDVSQIHQEKYTPDDYRSCVLLSPEPSAIESAQGFHSPVVRVLCDEANGISMEVFNALMSNMSGVDSKLICAYNPIHPEGFTYEMEGRVGFYVIEMSALNHPNVVEGKEVYPGAITREKVDADLQTWSKECTKNFPGAVYVPWSGKFYQPTPQILTRILGKWHLLSHDGAIDPAILEAAIYSDPPSPGDIASVGVDVSRGLRDATVLATISKSGKLHLTKIYHNNLMDLADKVMARTAGFPTGVDDTGIGAGLTDRLLQMGHKKVYPVNFSAKPQGFVNGDRMPYDARTEMFLLYYQALQSQTPGERLMIPRDPILLRESTTIRLVPVYGGRFVKMEAKDHIRRRIKASTDNFDAAGIALYARELDKRLNTRLFLTR